MSRSKNRFYSTKRIIRLSKRLFIFSGGRCNGKTQFCYDLMEDLRKHGKIVLVIRKHHARSLNVKASRKKLIRRGCQDAILSKRCNGVRKKKPL